MNSNESIATVTTEIHTSVIVTVFCQCPYCGSKIVRVLTLSEESLHTGNTTETASYAVDMAKLEINSDKKRRGWLDNKCGKCRDK